MPVSDIRWASLDRQIDQASYTVAMLQGALAKIERRRGDASMARHYLHETQRHLDELRQERNGLQCESYPNRPRNSAGMESVGRGQDPGRPTPQSS